MAKRVFTEESGWRIEYGKGRLGDIFAPGSWLATECVEVRPTGGRCRAARALRRWLNTDLPCYARACAVR